MHAQLLNILLRHTGGGQGFERERTDCNRLGREALLRCCVVCKHAVAGAALVHKRGSVTATPAPAQRVLSAAPLMQPILVMNLSKQQKTGSWRLVAALQTDKQ